MNKNIFCNLNKKAMTSKENISVVNYHLKKKKKKDMEATQMSIYIWFAWIEKMWCACIYVYMHVCVCVCVWCVILLSH